MRPLREVRSLLILFFLLAATLPVAAQALTGSIVGTVTDSSGAFIPGASVTISSSALLREQTFVTTETGEFRFPAVPPGSYTVNAELPGFGPTQRTDVSVNVGGTARVNMVLSVQGVTETVTVSGQLQTVDVDTTRLATTFSTSTLQAVPFQRDFYDVLKVTPGVVNDNLSYRATTSISGAGVRNTGYGLDGTNLTDAAASYPGIRHLNYDTFEEIEVITGAMPAEIGSASGGFVNIVTKSGGNDFHGGGSYFFANEALQSGLSQSVLDRGIRPGSTGISMLSDATFDLGGRIKRDRVWFYGSYRRFDNDTVGIGYRYARLKLPEDNDVSFAKITTQLNAAHKVSVAGTYIDRYQPQFTYTVSPFRDYLGNWYMAEKGPAVSSQWQWVPNQETYVETRFGMLLKETWYEIQPGSTEPSTYDFITTETTHAQPRGQNDGRDRYQFSTSVQRFAGNFLGGSHEFKTGFDFSHFSHLQSDSSLAGYQRQFTGTASTYVQFANGYPDRIARYKKINEYGFFLQDRWTIKRLTLNIGLRFDSAAVIFPAQNFPAKGLFPELQSISIYQPVDIPRTTLANWKKISPRAGFTYNLTGDQKTPLKGSYSRYNDQVFSYLFGGPMSWKTSTHNWTDNNGNRLVDRGEFGPAISVVGAGGDSDPNARRPYWDEWTLGIERELGARISVGARGIYRKNKDIFDDVDIGTEGGWYPVTIYDPGPDGIRGNSDDVGATTAYDLRREFLGKNVFRGINVPDAVRRYKGLELTANKRYSDRWMLFSSLVISRTDGNIGNDYGGTAGVTGSFNNPNTRINEYGLLALDSTYQFKVAGTYTLPLGIDVGGLYMYLTGNPLTRTVRTNVDSNGRRLDAGTITINAEPLGSQRLPAQSNVNINFSRIVKLEQHELKFAVDILNVTNANTVLTQSTLSGATYGRVTSIMPPRYVRLGIRYHF